MRQVLTPSAEERDLNRRIEIADDALAIIQLVYRWQESELAIRTIIEDLGTDLGLEKAQGARDKAANALRRSVADL